MTTDQTCLSYIVDNPAYSQVLAENIWGKAIARIKTIFAEWDRNN